MSDAAADTNQELNLDYEHIECAVTSLIREYLARKGLKNTLDTFDQENLNTAQNLLNSRTKLIEYLCIRKLYEKNKTIKTPYKTILELLLSFLTVYFKNLESTNTKINTNENMEYHRNLNFNKKSTLLNHQKKSIFNDIRIEDTNEGEVYDGNDKRFESKNEDKYDLKSRLNKLKSDKLNEKSNGKKLNSHNYDMNKLNSSSFTSKNDSFDNRLSNDNLLRNKNMNENNKTLTSSPSPSSSSPSSNGYQNEFKSSNGRDKNDEKNLDDMIKKLKGKSDNEKNDLVNKLESTQQRMVREKSNLNTDNRLKSTDTKMTKSRSYVNLSSVTNNNSNATNNYNKQSSSNLLSTASNNDAALIPKDYKTKQIDFEAAKSLRMLVFGNLNQTFNEEWKNQSFTFCDLAKLKFGLVQKKGGPCGVLASVQAYILLEMIFSNSNTDTGLRDLNTIFNVNKKDRSRALAKGLANLLWKCGEKNNEAIITTSTHQAHFAPTSKYKSDGITETLNLFSFNNYKSLEDFLIKNINSFELDGSNGCILLLYSAIFSRTIKEVISDMDDKSNKLMGMHGYCTQEMVNLLIHGRAVSNVFNDSIYLDQLELRGPNKRNDIGLLSLFEHYKSCEVGSYYKTPKYPIWVICSESHFSVLFCLNREILNDWKAETRFDLYYYDGLAKQDEQIRLTISSSKYEDSFIKMLSRNKKMKKI